MTTRSTLHAVPDPLMLVDGRLVAAAHGAAYPVVDPTSGAILTQAPDASAEDMDAAITAARRALDETGWSRDPALRARCVRELHAALVEHGDAVRALLTAEGGVPVALTRGRQYDEPVAGLLEATAAEPDRPAGVLAVLTPFTDPLRIALERLGRALMRGDTVVLKPAADTPWSACELGRLVAEHTDLPPGVVNVVPTRDVDVAIGLTTDPRVDAVALTGSAVVAERVRHQAAGKHRTIDVGAVATVTAGDSDDPAHDLAAVVADTARGVASHAGQACGVPARLVVPRDRHEEALELAVAAMSAHTPGDPADPATVCGPVISAVHRDRVRRYLALAEHEGGKILVGGAVPPGDRPGFWVEPAVVAGLGADARAAREEVLGPVLFVLQEES